MSISRNNIAKLLELGVSTFVINGISSRCEDIQKVSSFVSGFDVARAQGPLLFRCE